MSPWHWLARATLLALLAPALGGCRDCASIYVAPVEVRVEWPDGTRVEDVTVTCIDPDGSTVVRGGGWASCPSLGTSTLIIEHGTTRIERELESFLDDPGGNQCA